MFGSKYFRASLFGLLILSAIALAMFNYSPRSGAQIEVAGQQTNVGVSGPTVAVSNPLAAQALARLQNSGAQVFAHASNETGVYDFVRATGNGVIVTDNALATPEMRARAFLNQHGGLVGMNDTERALALNPAATGVAGASALSLSKVYQDNAGQTHVRLDQKYLGMQVFGAQLVVHMNSSGITGVNGDFVPGVNVAPSPAVAAQRARQIAIGHVVEGQNLQAAETELAVYRTGLLEGFRGENVLAYAVVVTDGKAIRDQVWVEAAKGRVLNRISLNPHGLDRIIYTPEYGEPFDVRHEGDPLTPGATPGTSGADPINNLYVMAGHTYNMFRSAFGHDSYDNAGRTMHSVYLVNDICPNAYWNGVSTNYCPDFDADDVVSHEWGHAYTQFTHNLIYSYQSGALNESYSDIFGETADLLNGVDAEGGANNSQPMPTGQRWQVGEDVQGFNQPALGILRDMWTPTRFGDPDKVSATQYACGSGDGGGVHTNSGVPNHAFAMLVDGKTFNGQTVAAIGFTRALAIYYRAMTVYQTPTTDFVQHAVALQTSCNDLIGQPLNSISTSTATGSPSSDVITSATCQQVEKALLAVEMSQPTSCPVSLLLEPDAPATCDGATDIFSEDWETGDDGWTRTSTGVFADWEDSSRNTRDFSVTSTLPAGRTGSAALARNIPLGEPGGGDCQPGSQDYSGQYTIDSPSISIPAGASNLQMRFDHYVATEATFDGGQVEISVNGGAFSLVPQANYVFNAPGSQFEPPPPVGLNTNPNAGEYAWHGTNVGTPASQPRGSWGTTVIDLSSLTNPGDTIKVRFNFSQDGCNGVEGWYVDDIRVYSCPVLEAPTLSLGPDYTNPDPDGSYTLNWTRPAGASGPDVLQESSVCGPLLSSDGSSLTGWTAASGPANEPVRPMWQTSSTKPNHEGNSAFWANPVSETETQNTFATLTYNDPIAIPATGITTLRFSEWYFNEDDDKGYVEVSTDNGATWTPIYTNARPMSDLPDAGAAAFAEEGLSQQAFDLTIYSGQTIRLRFRYALGQSNFVFFVQYGWYIDDISITNDSFTDVVTTNGTSHTVTGRPTGTRCYRVRSNYTFGSQVVPGPYSNQATAVSSLVECVTNFAHSSFGSVASATSTYTSRNYSPAGAINGDRTGAGWEQGGGWNDSTRGQWPDALEVNFNTNRTISEIRVYTLQNDFHNPQEPTEDMTCEVYGLLDFDVQTWDGNNWVTVPGGEIRNNNLVISKVNFPSTVTSKIRILVHNARANFSRIVEVEAIGCQ